MNSEELCLNPCAAEFAPSNDINRKEERIQKIVDNDDSATVNSVNINDKTNINTNVDNENIKNNAINNKMSMWIKDGRIFKKVASTNKHALENKEMKYQSLNCCSMLDDYDIQENSSEISMCKEKIEALEAIVEKKTEAHDVKKISYEQLEMTLVNHMVEADIERNHADEENKEAFKN